MDRSKSSSNRSYSGPRPSRIRILKRRCEDEQSIDAIKHIKSEPDLPYPSSEELPVPPADTVCRVCLVKHLKLYTVRNDLQNVYETVTGEEYNKPDYPVCMCYICLAELRRCHRFVETARDSNRVLEQWSNQQHMIKMVNPFRTYAITPIEATYIGEQDVPSDQLVKTEVEDLQPEEFDYCDINTVEKYEEIDNDCSDTLNDINYIENTYNDTLQDNNDIQQESKCPLVDQAPGTSSWTASNTEILNFIKNIKTGTDCTTKEIDNICNTKSNLNPNLRTMLILNTKNNSVPNPSILISNIKGNSTSNTYSNSTSNTYSNSTSNTYSNSTSNTYSNSTSNTYSNSTSNTYSNSTSNTYSNSTSNTNSNSTSNTNSNSTSNTKSNFVSKIKFCSVCNFEYVTESDLWRHMRFHDNSRPHVCDVCRYRFEELIDLKKHSVMHRRINEYVCDQCEFRSIIKREIYDHVTRAHKNKIRYNYTCDDCKYTFTNKSYLRAHINQKHKGKKLFSCDKCCNNYRHIGGLKHHLLSKHGQNWYI